MINNIDNKISKIAFCFLTYHDIIGLSIWNEFFKNQDHSKYCVIIHPKITLNFNATKYNFPIKIVKNRINTRSKTDISIVNATLQMFKECYNSDNSITHFIFLSQSCIPLYSFNMLYKIISLSDKSIISFIDHNKKERFHQLDNQLKRIINYSKFVKQQPNMILVRSDIELLINRNLTAYFSKMECPDEHYFINVLLYVFNRHIIKQQTHYCNPDLNKTQALEFNNVDRNFIEHIRSKLFLFMRKITNNSNVDINYLLD
jgi:hypothetical protein